MLVVREADSGRSDSFLLSSSINTNIDKTIRSICVGICSRAELRTSERSTYLKGVALEEEPATGRARLSLLETIFGKDGRADWGAATGLGGGDDGIKYVPMASDSEDTAMDGPTPQVQLKKLKDMFVPRAEDAAFSILGNFDLDLELDNAFEAPFAPAPTPYRPTFTSTHSSPHSALSTPTVLAPALDTNMPLFFPRFFSPE
ncbi:hypothetical protein DFH11DRAFT_1729194 [Phellopilus nigrolimitatus]|nr:hypothetical protein DFH11DRAFT_1729194 [Phellopilus nigrolimitatus]